MNQKPIVLAICGSTRKSSSNLNLIREIGDLAGEKFHFRIYDCLMEIAPFDPEKIDAVPDSVIHFSEAVRTADGVLICTPEYAGGAPGVLKNALDWSVSLMSFSKRPVALITASLAGKFTHQSLLGTLLTIDARLTPSSQLLISMLRTKLSTDGKITDESTFKQVIQLINALFSMITDPEDQAYLEAPSLM